MESGARFHKSCRCTVAMSSADTNGRSIYLPADEYERLTIRGPDGKLPEFMGYEVTQFDYLDDSPGMKMPERAPWADSFRSAPRLRDVTQREYDEYRDTAGGASRRRTDDLPGVPIPRVGTAEYEALRRDANN